MKDLLLGLAKWEQSMDDDPLKRDFAGLKRDEKGRLNDDELVQILVESIEDCAGKLRFNDT